jgi:DNA-binding protein HU-beta
MAKAKKRPTKSAARKTPAAKKSAAAKKATAKRNVATKKAAVKKVAVKSKTATQKTASSKTATPKQKPAKQIKVKTQRAEQAPKELKTNSDVPQNDKKKLAAQHMWDLVQAKKQRAAQTPAWQAIQHHDHPAPRASSDLASDQGGSSSPPEMPGHRDRGTG